MKTILLTLFAALALTGCATSKSTISGNTPSTTGPSAKSIWQQQLSAGSRSQTGKGTIRSVRGDHTAISSAANKSVPAKIGHTLKENSIATTGPGSQLDIFLADNGPVIRLTENSQVKFTRLGLSPSNTDPAGPKIINTMLDLTKGRLMGNVKKLAPGSSYLVRTRNGLIRIHGTEFTITADGQCAIVEGRAELIRHKSHYTLTSGQSQ